MQRDVFLNRGRVGKAKEGKKCFRQRQIIADGKSVDQWIDGSAASTSTDENGPDPDDIIAGRG
jgi:hypothetical protein